MDRLQEQLMGRHGTCLVCVKCRTVHEMEEINGYAETKGDNIIQFYCKSCNDKMFSLGLSEDMEDTYQARLELRLATNTIEEVKSIVSNVITDDELGEINSLLGERKESIQDTLLDIEFVETNE